MDATIDGSTEAGMDCRVTILTPSAVLSTVITLASGAPESSSRPAMKSGSLNNANTSVAGASYCCVTFSGVGTDGAPDGRCTDDRCRPEGGGCAVDTGL